MATLSYSYCVSDLPDHITEPCIPRKKSGISAIAVILPGHGITDFTNAVEVQAAIDDGKFKVIGGCEKGTRFEYPAASPVEGDPDSACLDTTIDGYDHLVNGEDFNVNAENDEFYGQLHLVKGACLILYYCSADEMRLVTDPLTFRVTNPISDFSHRIKQKYSVSVSWFTDAGNIGSELLAAPEGIFC